MSGREETTTHISGKYVALGNIYINKFIDRIDPRIPLPVSTILLITSALVGSIVECPGKYLEAIEQAMVAFGVAGSVNVLLHFTPKPMQAVRGIIFTSVFMILFYLHPAQPLMNHCDRMKATGRITLADRPLAGVRVALPDHGGHDCTNQWGEFAIALDHQLTDRGTRLTIDYAGRDTVITVHPEGLQQRILIRLPDTLSGFSERLARALVWETVQPHLAALRHKVSRFAKEYHARASSLLEIEEKRAFFEQLPGQRHVDYEFQSWQTSTVHRVNLQRLGLHLADTGMHGDVSGMMDPTVLLLLDIPELDGACFIEYVFLNPADVQLAEVSLQKRDALTYRIRAHFEQGIRYVRYRLEKSVLTAHKKQCGILFCGLLPEEEFTAVFSHGHWQIEKGAPME